MIEGLFIDELNTLLGRPLIQTLIAFFLAAVAILVAVFLYFRSKPNAGLGYHLAHKRLLGYESQELPADIRVTFKNKEVSRLDKLLLLLWNCGNTTINGSQIAESDYLRITLPDSQILDVKVINYTREVNKVIASIVNGEPSQVQLTFDFLDPKDGVVIEVLYEKQKRTDDQGNLPQTGYGNLVQGTIRGMPRGFINYKDKYPASMPIRIFWSVMSILFLPFSLISMTTSFKTLTLGLIFFNGVCIALGGVSVVMLMTHRQRFPKSLSTKDFYVG